MTFLRLILLPGNQGETIHQRARHHGGALHTDDVPSNYLALLSNLWTLRKVDHGTGESHAIAAVTAVDLQWNRTQLGVLP